MIIDVTKITKICVKLRIDIEEFYFLYLVSTRDNNNMMRYVNHIDGFSEKFRKNLEKKGFLMDSNIYRKDDEERVVKFDKLFTTPLFDEQLEEVGVNLNLNNAYEELLEVYPYEFSLEGDPKRYNARTGFYESNSSKYTKYILTYPDKHNEIIKATKYGRDNNLIRVGLEKYIDGRLWEGIMEQMGRSFGNASSDLE